MAKNTTTTPRLGKAMTNNANAAELFDSLSTKLGSLDLTESESDVLDLILSRAAALDNDEDVSGFAMNGLRASGFTIPDNKPVLMQNAFGQKLGLSAGVINASVLTPTEGGRV